MNINHHLDQATIVAYAAGTLGEALTVVASSHVAWCPTCRGAVRNAEALGAELMSGLEAADVSADCKSRTLAQLDRATLHRFPRVPAPRGQVPPPLARLLGGKDLSDLPWKRKGAGVAMFELPLQQPSHGKLVLMRIASGKSMPEHGHGGEELTLILSGAYRDKIGHFGPGDVADLDEEIEHRPVVEDGAVCYCLVATEAPTRFKSISARLLQPFIGI